MLYTHIFLNTNPLYFLPLHKIHVIYNAVMKNAIFANILYPKLSSIYTIRITKSQVFHNFFKISQSSPFFRTTFFPPKTSLYKFKNASPACWKPYVQFHWLQKAQGKHMDGKLKKVQLTRPKPLFFCKY